MTFTANGPNGVNVGAVANKSGQDIVCLLIIVVPLFLKKSAVVEEVNVFLMMPRLWLQIKMLHKEERVVHLNSEYSIICKVMFILNGLNGRPVPLRVEPVGRAAVK